MSNQALRWARGQMPRRVDGSPNPTAKAVLVQLCDMADDGQQQCFPGQGTLSKLTGLGVDTVAKSVRVLEEQGYITRSERRYTKGAKKGHRTSDLYTVIIARPGDDLSRGVPQPPALQKAVRRARQPRPSQGPLVPVKRRHLVPVYGKQPLGEILRPEYARGWDGYQALPMTTEGRWEDYRDNGPGPMAERRTAYDGRTEHQEPPLWHYERLKPSVEQQDALEHLPSSSRTTEAAEGSAAAAAAEDARPHAAFVPDSVAAARLSQFLHTLPSWSAASERA